MSDDTEALRRALVAYAEWETLIGGDGWPAVDPASRTLRSAARLGAPDAEVPADRRKTLLALAEQAASCTRCALHAGRGSSVFARGDEGARVVFVGPAPGRAEEASGAPIAGEAGALLDRMITAMGLTPESVYICSVVKCALPDPHALVAEAREACAPFLAAQLEAVGPEVIVALGEDAAQALGDASAGPGAWRGAWTEWRGIPVMATHAPSEVIETPALRRPVWDDLQAVMAHLGLRR